MSVERRIENLSKIFNSRVNALDNDLLSIPAGMHGLLGADGAGRSGIMRTLLSILFAWVLFAGLGTPARAQDASKIVEQYIRAAGGTQVIAKIRTLAI